MVLSRTCCSCRYQLKRLDILYNFKLFENKGVNVMRTWLVSWTLASNFFLIHYTCMLLANFGLLVIFLGYITCGYRRFPLPSMNKKVIFFGVASK